MKYELFICTTKKKVPICIHSNIIFKKYFIIIFFKYTLLDSMTLFFLVYIKNYLDF